MNSEHSLSELLKDSETAEHMLWDIPLEQRQHYYSELCEFVQWALERQRDERRLVQFEKDLVDSENHLKDKVNLGELSEIKLMS